MSTTTTLARRSSSKFTTPPASTTARRPRGGCSSGRGPAACYCSVPTATASPLWKVPSPFLSPRAFVLSRGGGSGRRGGGGGFDAVRFRSDSQRFVRSFEENVSGVRCRWNLLRPQPTAAPRQTARGFGSGGNRGIDGSKNPPITPPAGSPSSTSASISSLVPFLGRTYRDVASLTSSAWSLLSLYLPRLLAFGGTLHMVDEYGIRQVSCEGPSMEPTIMDGTGTVVLVDRFSHRIYGLEISSPPPLTSTSTSAGGDEGSGGESSEKSSERWLTVIKTWYRHFTSGIDRGDVVIMQHPFREGTICKRVVGMPGDAVARNDGWEALSPSLLEVKAPSDDEKDEGGAINFERDISADDETANRIWNNVVVVPPGHLWIEGDNPSESSDSRYYGAVPAALIVGKVACRLWPLVQKRSLGKDPNGTDHWETMAVVFGRDGRPKGGGGKIEKNWLGSRVLGKEERSGLEQRSARARRRKRDMKEWIELQYAAK